MTTGYLDTLSPKQKDLLLEMIVQMRTDLRSLGQEHLKLWGVHLEDLVFPGDVSKVGSGIAAFADHSDGPTRAQAVVLLKFLRSSNWDVPKALKVLSDCLQARKMMNFSTILDESFPPQLQNLGEQWGVDKHGNPVTYFYYGGSTDLVTMLASKAGLVAFMRWHVAMRERAIAQLDFEKGREHITEVHDYSGAEVRRMMRNPRVRQASKRLRIATQAMYPEIIASKIILCMPPANMCLARCFSCCLSSAYSADDLAMATPGQARAVLQQYVEPSQVPLRCLASLPR